MNTDAERLAAVAGQLDALILLAGLEPTAAGAPALDRAEDAARRLLTAGARLWLTGGGQGGGGGSLGGAGGGGGGGAGAPGGAGGSFVFTSTNVFAGVPAEFQDWVRENNIALYDELQAMGDCNDYTPWYQKVLRWLVVDFAGSLPANVVGSLIAAGVQGR